ncbi:sensor histidine kinase [Sunxiuqinia sp. sy24]|uniref:sensor histidine kinase n=1 Tax=Sunxiuqinia sp. sy24 TaxID=3461495 RepID=UPI004045E22F
MENQFLKEFIASQKKVIEKLQERNEELECLLNRRNQLFLIMSHDLRNPFNSILGFSQLLLKQSEQFDAESQHFIHSIHSQAKLTFDLLERLIEWAKTQFDNIEDCLEEVNLSELVEEVVAPYAEAATIKSISVTHVGVIKNSLRTDPAIIRVILANMLSNAIKYTYPAGKVDIYSTKNDGQIEISIVDNGVGMSREDIANLFRLGKEFSSPGTANESGLGVGLSLCKELIERLNGHIRVGSELGKGSRFTVSLPDK